MPIPPWTAQYDFGKTPEANGFTRTLYNTPVVTLTTTGPTAGRKVSVDSTNGDCVFSTTAVPALDDQVGATVELVVGVTGLGDAGFELTFLNHAFGVSVYADRVEVTIAQDAAPGQVGRVVATAPNAGPVTFRATFSVPDGLRVYRDGVLILSEPLPVSVHPVQRVLWWGEAGGVQTFTALRYWLGGAMPPG